MASTKDYEKASRAVAGVVKGWGKKAKPKGPSGPSAAESRANADRILRGRTMAEQKQVAAGNRRNATAAARNKGTYDTYDPLSSIKTKQTMKKAIKRSKKA